MKKAIIIIISLIIVVTLSFYLVLNNYFKNDTIVVEEIKVEEIVGQIDSYNIYGMYFNLSGSISLENIDLNNFKLVLKSLENEIIIPSIFNYQDNILSFKTSEYINDGIILDSLDIGNYYLLLKDTKNNKYYTFENNSSYGELTYYTITKNKKNNEINILFNESTLGFHGLNINVHQEKLPSNVYDITIDPGHGGRDSGSLGSLNGETYMEKDINLAISLKLKEELEKLGYKVLITRETDINIESYGDEGRAVLPNKYKTKLCLSIHQNSDNIYLNDGGLEVYIANDTKEDLAVLFANNLIEDTNTEYSFKLNQKITDGVYRMLFTDYTIEEALIEWEHRGYVPYEITKETPYMFMIREVGGLVTHAYVDGRNPQHGNNLYYDSNQTAEAILFELGYIIHPPDLENLLNNKDLYAKSIANTLSNFLKEI